MEIGHRLRQARESMGYTLEEMAEETQIHVSYLAALEAGDWNSLPSPYYARAYLRTYGSSLGLDPKSLVQQVRRTGGGVESRRSTRPSPKTGTHQRRRTLPPEPLSGEDGKQVGSRRGKNDRRQGHPESGAAVEETAAGQLALPSRGSSGARRPSLPPDMPEPQELGLSPRKKTRQSLPPSPVVEAEEDQQSSRLHSTHAEDGNQLSRTARSKRGKEGKSSKQTLVTWHIRLLKWGAILLIPATIGLIWLTFFSDGGDAQPETSEKTEGETAAAEERAEETDSAPASDTVLTPIETGENIHDRYELTGADQIELQLKATGECWFQIRSQEAGGMLEDKVLNTGDTFPFSYEDGKTLWLQLGNASNVDVTVNGKKVNTNYQGSKQIQINRVN
ncbi:helix-turn-helix domain-containing protein [Desmospora activa]|nr:helix-turn-helix domain-containing protein [Desmospora activa]